MKNLLHGLVTLVGLMLLGSGGFYFVVRLFTNGAAVEGSMVALAMIYAIFAVAAHIEQKEREWRDVANAELRKRLELEVELHAATVQNTLLKAQIENS